MTKLKELLIGCIIYPLGFVLVIAVLISLGLLPKSKRDAIWLTLPPYEQN